LTKTQKDFVGERSQPVKVPSREGTGLEGTEHPPLHPLKKKLLKENAS